MGGAPAQGPGEEAANGAGGLPWNFMGLGLALGISNEKYGKIKRGWCFPKHEKSVFTHG